MNTKKRYLYFNHYFLFFILNGCVSEKGYWYNDGLTQDELSKVRYICLQQSRQYHDIINRKTFSNRLADAYRDQANSIKPMNRGQANEKAILNGFAAGLTRDTTDDREHELYLACMNAHGVYWKTEK